MTIMTQAEEFAELRKWIREDIGKIRDKIDDYIKDNNESHVDFQVQLSKINIATTVNKVKLGFINGGIALFVSSIISVGALIIFSMGGG